MAGAANLIVGNAARAIPDDWHPARDVCTGDGGMLTTSNPEWDRQFRLLTAFVERPGRVLSRDTLIELTRAAGVDVNDRSIDLAVSRLRAKLGDSPKEPHLIKTLRGEGYLFDAQVQEP